MKWVILGVAVVTVLVQPHPFDPFNPQAGSNTGESQPPAFPPLGGQYPFQPHGGQPHGGQPHEGQPHSGHPHGGQPHGGQPNSGQPHGGQPHGGQLPFQPFSPGHQSPYQPNHQGHGHPYPGHSAQGQNGNAFGSHSKPCKSDADCDASECCVHDANHSLIDLASEQYAGSCQAMLGEGSMCDVENHDPFPIGAVYARVYCPCAAGFGCKNSTVGFGFFQFEAPACTNATHVAAELAEN